MGIPDSREFQAQYGIEIDELSEAGQIVGWKRTIHAGWWYENYGPMRYSRLARHLRYLSWGEP
jgi:hypothetical protein